MRRRSTSDEAIPEARRPVSVALLAGVAFMPVVIAVGFMADPTDRAIPGDISVSALRGGLDGITEHRAPPPARAGF